MSSAHGPIREMRNKSERGKNGEVTLRTVKSQLRTMRGARFKFKCTEVGLGTIQVNLMH